MLVGSVPGHQVQTHPDALGVGLEKERLHVFVGSVAWVHPVVVGDVVSSVSESGAEDRPDPEGVESEFLYVVQFLADALQVADPVTVRVLERRWKYMVDGRLIQPGGIGLAVKLFLSAEQGRQQKEDEGGKSKSNFHRLYSLNVQTMGQWSEMKSTPYNFWFKVLYCKASAPL